MFILSLFYSVEVSSSILSSNTGNKIEEIKDISEIETSKPIDFTLKGSMDKDFLKDDTTIIDNNISTILEQIPDYLPNETQYFTNIIVPEYYITVTIDNITVFDDKDGIGMGAGEIYLNVWANTVFSKLNNSGSYYSLNNDESATVNLDVFTGWTNSTSLYINVKESDVDFDDDLGNITINGIYDYNFSTSYYTNTNDALVWITATITDHRSIAVDSYAIASYYQPYIYLDNGDYADTPTDLFYRVLTGFDTEIQENVICLQYFYYWPLEMDNFGADLGHYYDFSPVFIYIKDLGELPYRIVFQENNPGATALPAYVSIYSDQLETTGEAIANVSEALTPLLGTQAKFNYDIHSIENILGNSDNYVNGSTEFPNIISPILMVTDSYHNMQAEYIAFDNTEIGFSPTLTPFSKELIVSNYELLNESFNSPLNDYSWNNYEVPENLSLTLDMLQNPLKFPFIADCFENVTHQNRFARDGPSIDFYGNTQLNTTLIIPGTLYMEYPSILEPGNSDNVSIWVDMDGNNVRVVFDYLINLNASLEMWYIKENMTFNYDGQVEIKIPLDTISSLQRMTGFNGASDLYDFGDYLSIESLYVNTTLLGVIANASVSVHLFDIIRDLVILFKPELKPLFTIAEYFVKDIDLLLVPEITGQIVGEIETSNSGVATLSASSFRLNKENTPINIMISVIEPPAEQQFTIDITSINYAINFTNDWSLRFIPGKFLDYFEIEEFSIPLATYPNLEWNVGDPKDSLGANITLIQSEIIYTAVISEFYLSLLIVLIIPSIFIAKKRRKF